MAEISKKIRQSKVGRTDFSQPVERRPVAPEIHEVRTWRYRDGDGAVARFDAGEEAPLGAWSFAADSYAAMQGEKVLRNPLFSPSLNAAGHYLNAPSALIPEVGDRDDAEEDGTNFTLRIVRYAGMHPLPGDERWGYPSGRSEYPLAAFGVSARGVPFRGGRRCGGVHALFRGPRRTTGAAPLLRRAGAPGGLP